MNECDGQMATLHTLRYAKMKVGCTADVAALPPTRILAACRQEAKRRAAEGRIGAREGRVGRDIQNRRLEEPQQQD